MNTTAMKMMNTVSGKEKEENKIKQKKRKRRKEGEFS